MRLESLDPYWQKFRKSAHKNTHKLIYMWAVCTSAGLAYIYYKQKKGEDYRISRNDMLPDVKVAEKVVYWIRLLGLDQTIDNPKRK